MEMSARNRLKGTVKSLKEDGLMAQVTIELPDGQSITSIITRDAAQALSLQQGDTVYAIIKSTRVTTQCTPFRVAV